jgi:hypothetical protein
MGLQALQPGDVVTVTKLDRLGRSTRELLELIDRIGKVGAAFRSFGDPLWDTSSAQGRLLSTLLAGIATLPNGAVVHRRSAPYLQRCAALLIYRHASENDASALRICQPRSG